MSQRILLLTVSWLFVYTFATGQSISFEENFETWEDTGICPVGWECTTSSNCISESFCYWRRNDDFSEIGLPDSMDCDGSGHYARLNTVSLQFGQIPTLISPAVDLGQADSNDGVEVSFCYINGSSLPIDQDGIRVFFSADSGATWSLQFVDNSRSFNSWRVVSLPVENVFKTPVFRIKIEGISGNSTGDIGIDGLTVANLDGDCEAVPFTIATAQNTQLCKDSLPDLIAFTDDIPDTVNVEVAYILTNESDSIIEEIPGSGYNFDLLPLGTYHVHGIAYVGILNMDGVMALDSLSATVCEQLADQPIEITVGEINAEIRVTSAFGTSVSCNGARDAQLTVEVNSGTAPYTYAWNTNATQAVLNDVGAGTYTVLVTDANQCKVRDTVVIQEPAPLAVDVNITSDYNGRSISCNGANDGSVFVSVAGGSRPYSYLWSNGATGDSLINLAARQYIVFVRDSNGCVGLDSVRLTNPQPLSVSAEVTSNFNGNDISEPEAMDGEATATAEGGTPPYNFAWNTTPPTLASVATGLGAGKYTVTGVDANGCVSSNEVVIRNPGEIGLVIRPINDFNGSAISCTGANDGAITALVDGGIPPYTYRWDTNPVQTTDTLRNLGPGIYSVTITDSLGAQAQGSITLTEPSPLEIEVQTVDPRCTTDTTGIITLSLTGGTSPYTYEWEGLEGINAAVASGLTAGVYGFEVIDANGCAISSSASLEAGAGVRASFAVSDESCPGNADGAIMTLIESGAPPYDIRWSTGESQQDLMNISAGTYSIRIVDSVGCDYSDTLVVNSLDTLSLEVSTTPDNGNQNGTATAMVAGGLPPFTYTWNTNPGNNEATLEGLALGMYELTVIDAAGCTISTDFEVEPQSQQCPPVHSGMSPNGDGINDTWFIPCLDELGEHEVTLYGRWGQEIINFVNYDNTWNGEVNGNALPAGTYFFVLRRTDQTRVYKGTITIVR